MAGIIKLIFGDYKIFFKAITKYGTPPWGQAINREIDFSSLMYLKLLLVGVVFTILVCAERYFFY
jgi:hypothetical protein